MSKYAIGIDYGTLSGRALLTDVSDGRAVASSVFEYPHAVMDKELPCGKALGEDWALQDPRDYLEVIYRTVPDVLRQSGVSPDDVIGVGVDFTACTLLPVKADGTPLCCLDGYADEPNAYVKLWKHHAAQKYADRVNAAAHERREPWIDNYGGKISSEWALPKIWQVLDESPGVYAAADKFIEAADWVVWMLTGSESRSACCAGYKEIYNGATGYPSKDFFISLDPGLENVTDKLGSVISPMGERAGFICPEMARRTGLSEKTAVAVAVIDAHVFVPAAGITEAGKMLAIMGTSTCHMVLGDVEKQIPGICGVVRDGILPGFFGYEAGHPCVGDSFARFIDSYVPQSYFDRAKEEGTGIHRYLRSKAERLLPGQSGLLVLDWFNGNRSTLVDADLQGMILGLTLSTTPEEIYRALIEATAFGTRMITDAFNDGGVPITEFYAAGGIAKKDPMMMQIYADVIKMPVRVVDSDQGGALGSAIFGAAAAGSAAGGYDDVFAAEKAMSAPTSKTYLPDEENSRIYDKIYAEYKTLYDYFGRGENDVMKRLKALKSR